MTKFNTLAKGFGLGLVLAATTAVAAVPERTTAPQSTIPQQLNTVLPTAQEQGCLPSAAGEFESETSTQAQPTEAENQVAQLFCYFGFCHGVYGYWCACW